MLTNEITELNHSSTKQARKLNLHSSSDYLNVTDITLAGVLSQSLQTPPVITRHYIATFSHNKPIMYCIVLLHENLQHFIYGYITNSHNDQFSIWLDSSIANW